MIDITNASVTQTGNFLPNPFGIAHHNVIYVEKEVLFSRRQEFFQTYTVLVEHRFDTKFQVYGKFHSLALKTQNSVKPADERAFSRCGSTSV